MPAARPAAAHSELVHRAAAGERSALDRLLQRHQGPLLERIRLMMGQRARERAESGDFVQDVMLEALQSYDRGHRQPEERHFLRWLTAIARNNIFDSLRRDRERAFASFSESWLSTDGGAPSPESEAQRQEDQVRLVEALESLSEEHRRVIELRSLDGLRFRDVALRMGRSPDAARMLFRRALASLGGALAGETD